MPGPPKGRPLYEAIGPLRRCTSCDHVGVLSDFGRDTSGGALFGYRPTCKTCRAAKAVARARLNPAAYRAKNRRGSLKTKYGMTVADFDQMVIAQCGQCAACDTQLRDPHIDHDHTTRAVRALLCAGCNLALGHLKDDAQRCISLAWYVMQHDSSEVRHD